MDVKPQTEFKTQELDVKPRTEFKTKKWILR